MVLEARNPCFVTIRLKRSGSMNDSNTGQKTVTENISHSPNETRHKLVLLKQDLVDTVSGKQGTCRVSCSVAQKTAKSTPIFTNFGKTSSVSYIHRL